MQEEYCTLDPITRKLTLTEPQRIAGVESDEYARGLKFKFPKTVDNIDLTQMQLRINFINSRQEKGQHIVTDMKPMEGEEGYITFTWPFSRLVTKYRGLTKFIVCAIKTDLDGTITTEWNTALAQLRVLEGLEVDESDITPEEKDIIAQLIAICETAIAESVASAQWAQVAAEQAAQGAQKSEAAATEADVSAQEAETSAVNSAASAQQAQTAAEQAAQEAQQSETSATESAASAQRAQEEAEKVLDIIPAGGTKGQVLTKQSDADKDYNWQDPAGGGGTVNKYELIDIVEITEDDIKVYEKTLPEYYTAIIVSAVDYVEGTNGRESAQFFTASTDMRVILTSEKESGNAIGFKTTGWGHIKTNNSFQAFKENGVWKGNAYVQANSGGLFLVNGAQNYSGFMFPENLNPGIKPIESFNKIKIEVIKSEVFFANPTKFYVMGVKA